MRAGQGDRQFDQHEGRRGGFPATGPQGAPLRCRRGGDGLRRAGPGRYRRPEIRNLRPGLQTADREEDRKSVVEGKSVSVRVDLGGRRIIKKKKEKTKNK